MIGASYCAGCGTRRSANDSFCGACGRAFGPSHAPAVHAGPASLDADARMLERIADYERISGILWLILGIVQVLMIVTIIVGIWNIVAAISRMKLRPLILARDAQVPAIYEGVAQLVIIGVLNLLLGGAIGVLFVVFDFIIRDMVLRNRRLFENEGGGVEI